MKNGLRQIRNLIGRGRSPVFKIEAIRGYADAAPCCHTFALQNYSENYPALSAKHLKGAKLFASRETYSAMSF